MPTEDKARPVTVYEIFDGSPSNPDSPYTDFRALAVPADTEDEVAPKAEPAPAPAVSSDSTPKIEQTSPETPAQHPAAKDDGPTSPPESGNQTSSSPTPSGKAKPPAAPKQSRPST